MHTRFLRIAAALTLAFTLAGCGTSTITLYSDDGSKTVDVKVEIADSPKEREKGLMNRTTMEDGTGMLFVFVSSDMLSFWMKNTKIPLDILFFDEAGAFVSYTTMQPCTTDPCPVYKSAALSAYALEVNRGFRDTHGIGVGWKLNLDQVRKAARPT